MIAHIICMYCKTEYGQQTWLDDGKHTDVESHGICPECLPSVKWELWIHKLRKKRKELINRKRGKRDLLGH